jgi:hypothetical protein
MVMIAALLVSVLGATIAQEPPMAPPPGPAMQSPLQSGACLDSPRAVPKALRTPVSRALQIVRIDQIVSTSTMTNGEVIGFLYTTQDGSTWLGQRTANYMSPANATEINAVLGSTHLPSEPYQLFPPQTRYGVPTRAPQYFRVRLVPEAMRALQIEVAPCVAWPAERPLPDPFF